MISISTLKTLLFTLGPLLIPRLFSFYRTVRTQSQTSPLPIRPIPPQVRNALNILFVSCVFALISTLPAFSPENIISVTSSRLQTPNDVIFTRLSSFRPNNTLTEQDKILRNRLASLDGRCLYLTFGPSAIADCPFCNSDDPRSYLYYAMPSLLFPHLLNLFALGLATSSSISGREGGRWRTMAATIGAVIAVAECYIFGAYDWKANARVIRPEDLTYFYWRMRTFRGVVIAFANAGLAGLLWASSTNRIFVVPLSSAERLESVTRVLETARGKLGAVGIVRNVTLRDENFRKRGEAYWTKEGQVMNEVMDEREVVEGVRSALGSGRISVTRIEEEARNYAEGILGKQEGLQAR
ncbi:hypothetical protein MMC24_007868 [Lignoscripta atroalba]|nr:hypothetical protein [Lignoscripta atroalba]